MKIPTDNELDLIRDDYEKQWKDRNRSYPGEQDYFSGINDGLYLLRNELENKVEDSRKLTIQSSNDKLHLERVLSCISMSIETDGWPSFILNGDDIQTLINYLNDQLTIIKTDKTK